MAGWWIPWKMLEALRAIESREAMMMTNGKEYWWLSGGGCTPQAKGLIKRGLITRCTSYGAFDHMRITSTGLNTLRSHRGLTKKHYKL